MDGRTHERVWEQPQKAWQPVATYALLGIIVATFVAQSLVLARYGLDLHRYLFVIDDDFLVRPWSLITSTLSHGSTNHLLFNGLALFFLGPIIERVLGRRNYVFFFFLTGAITGMLQVLITEFMGNGAGALGASGAIMSLFGILMLLNPNGTVYLFFVLPLKIWMTGILFAVIDILGVFDPNSNIGNIAHLAGLAIGLVTGYKIKEEVSKTFRFGT